MTEELLTIEEAAQLLKVGPNTVRDWLRTGKIAGIKMGRLWRIRQSAIDAFLQESEQDQD